MPIFAPLPTLVDAHPLLAPTLSNWTNNVDAHGDRAIAGFGAGALAAAAGIAALARWRLG